MNPVAKPVSLPLTGMHLGQPVHARQILAAMIAWESALALNPSEKYAPTVRAIAAPHKAAAVARAKPAVELTKRAADIPAPETGRRRRTTSKPVVPNFSKTKE